MFRYLYRTTIALSSLLLLSVSLYAANGSPMVNRACDLSSSTSLTSPCAVIVKFKSDNRSQQNDVISKAKGKLKLRLQKSNIAAVEISDRQMLKQLASSPDVEMILPDRLIQITKRPTSPGGGTKGGKGDSGDGQIIPSGITRIGAAPGSLNYHGDNVGVAIVDTGIDMDNSDLNVSSSCWVSPDFGTCNDVNGHGTHVAGIVAALDNSTGVVGVAPKSTVYAVKALDDSGSGSDSTIMAGLEWVLLNANAVHPNIKVVNMSLGRPGSLNDNPLMHDLIKQLSQQGISVVVSAGNNPQVEVTQVVPATYPEVIAVSSTTAEIGANRCRSFSGKILADTASYFTTDGHYDSLTGIGVTVAAPGAQKEDINRSCQINSSGILSLSNTGGTTRKNGTSMAAPHVSGVVALMYQYNGALLPSEVKTLIRDTADRAGVVPLHSPTTSYSFDGDFEGVINACAVLSSC
ncbi:S8 family serine peptidase [Thiotrichales bacterium 19S11-10]|nr:S8 family serine peptidase [Thiotrichales bacterium 19S11-10]